MNKTLHMSVPGIPALLAALSYAAFTILPCAHVHAGDTNASGFAQLNASAEKGDAQAQNELGEDLFAGKAGVAKDAVAAVKWFRQAAEQNFPAAQYNLAVCYNNGEGVAKDEAEAVKWYRKSADKNDARAQFNPNGVPSSTHCHPVKTC